MRWWVVFGLLIVCSSNARALDIYLIRHFEKQGGPDPALTEIGVARAAVLADYLKDTPLAVVYSTPYQRTLQTAQPVAQATANVVTQYSAGDLTAFAKTLIERGQTVLVVGHSNTTPELVEALGGPEFSISEDEYGTLYHIIEVDGVVQMNTQPISLSK